MVRLARDAAESTGRRRTPPAGHVGGDLAGKGETDDWELVPETFFSVRRCANARCRTEGLDALITFVRGSVPWNWSCSPRMLVRASSRPPRWIREARTRCVRSPMRATTFHLRDFIPRQIHVAKANLPILRQSSFPTYGQTVSVLEARCPLLCICDSGQRCYKCIDSAFHLVSAASTLLSRHRRVLVFLFARFAGGHGALTLKLKTVS